MLKSYLFQFFHSAKLNQRDFAAQLVLSSHLQLQKDGFLSTWGNSFVGPWDPSQGLHNPGKPLTLQSPVSRIEKVTYLVLQLILT